MLVNNACSISQKLYNQTQGKQKENPSLKAKSSQDVVSFKSQLEEVTLSTGKKVTRNCLMVTSSLIDILTYSQPGWVAIYKLRENIKDPNHKINEESIALLKQHCLMKDDGSVNQEVKDIILARVKGDMDKGDLRIVDAITGE